jgi:hypothetical protein
MHLDDAVRKLLYSEQAERHFTMPRCKQGNDFSDECLFRSFEKQDGLRYWLMYVRDATRELPALVLPYVAR